MNQRSYKAGKQLVRFKDHGKQATSCGVEEIENNVVTIPAND